LLDQAVDAQVVGLVVLPHTAVALGGVYVAVAGNDRTVGDAHNERRIVEPAVGIDQQAREARADGRRAQFLRKDPCDGLGADVVGDVAFQLVGRKPQRAVVVRNGVAGVVAQQQQTGVAPAGDHFVAIGDEGVDERECLAPVGIWHTADIAFRSGQDHPRRRAA
jgi:hypothetical protein